MDQNDEVLASLSPEEIRHHFGVALTMMRDSAKGLVDLFTHWLNKYADDAVLSALCERMLSAATAIAAKADANETDIEAVGVAAGEVQAVYRDVGDAATENRPPLVLWQGTTMQSTYIGLRLRSEVAVDGVTQGLAGLRKLASILVGRKHGSGN
jgi:hypothetical protein